MRWFAFYLPQFHETEENNEWWGKGFTEWTHVNAAKPIYPGHRQPIAPLNDNYYNLMDKETVRWQTSLMKEYGIDGFVYYHYFFTGKKLLNKPAENLLQWKDIDQPFFFCWANHTWYQAKNGTKRVLIEQTYGTQENWEEHFRYLLPFFRDSRYEKKDNKPVFMIFRADFAEKKPMMEYFDRRCKESGFDGLYVIETFLNVNVTDNYADAFAAARENCCPQTEQMYIRQPDLAIAIENRKRRRSPMRLVRKVRSILAIKGIVPWVNRFDGNKTYDNMQNKCPRGEKVCHGVYFSWDNTPRHGVRGYVISPPEKERFMDYADSVKEDEYVFINAWNEWAEGMVMEPTTHDGYKYLEWIREWNDKNRDY